MLFNKKKKKINYFYSQFEILISYPEKAMRLVKEFVDNFDKSRLEEVKIAVHNVEHEADLVKKETCERLAKEFITPIDREDIFLLLDNIDDLTDAIDEITYKLYLHDYQSLPNNLSDFGNVDLQCVLATEDVIANLRYLTNKKLLDPLIEKVRNLEEECDHYYEENVKSLYKTVDNDTYLSVRRYEKIYSLFEYVSDKCRDIIKTVEMIMYKNL